ncbi:MAG: type II secretion system protein M [Draconibacterium sp.]|nr:type II secretion system protein M [Draconibacterium sp.]
MKEWFLKLSPRERIMIQVAGAAVLIFILYLLIVQPIASNYKNNKNNVAKAEESLRWMRTAAQEIRQLRGNSTINTRPKDNQSILSLVDSSARKAGLAKVMKRVQPETDSGVRVWFEDVAFDELINWLATIESSHGLSVNEINVEQTEVTGLVNVRVFLN